MIENVDKEVEAVVEVGIDILKYNVIIVDLLQNIINLLEFLFPRNRKKRKRGRFSIALAVTEILMAMLNF